MVAVDALHAQEGHARYLVEDRRAHYLVSVKNNQPTLARQLRTLPWAKVPVLDHREEETAAGCEELSERQSAAGIRYWRTNWSAAMRVSQTSMTRPFLVTASRTS